MSIVITGAAGDLGKAIAHEFSSHGSEVVAATRHELDVTDPANIRDFFAGRRVELLVCNAGMTDDQILFKQSSESWDEVMGVNYRGALRCARAALTEMKAQAQGHIVFISSYSALKPPIGQVAYATSKAALLGLTTGLAEEVGGHGIRVNAILPGFLETAMTAALSPQRKVLVRSSHVLGRLNTCDSVAGFVRFLHESLPHTSGQLFQLDNRVSGFMS